MSDSLSLKLYRTAGDPLIIEKCLSMRYEKEYYTPYSTLKAVFLTTENPLDIIEAELSVNGFLIHKGTIDTLETNYNGGIRTVSVTSRGKTSMLGQNELPEGIMSNVSLNSILDSSVVITGVFHENLSTTVSYIYVKEHATIWEALTNLCLKQYNHYPFIANLNTVRFTKQTARKFSLSDKKILSDGVGSDLSKALSSVHMKDVNDAYAYNLTDNEVVSMGIVRHKYLPLDKQWLQLSDKGLSYRINFSLRGYRYSHISYLGYMGEDLNDIVSYNGKNKEISRIIITAGKNGIVTKLFSYNDRYCNII